MTSAADLPDFTSDQQIFDYVVRHLAKQGGPSRGAHAGDMVCMYRNGSGRECAVGCLLADEEYHPDMEDKNIYGLNREDRLPLPLVPYLSLLASLQSTHDEAHTEVDERSIERWREPNDYYGIARRLASVAGVFRLSPAVVSECFPEAGR